MFIHSFGIFLVPQKIEKDSGEWGIAPIKTNCLFTSISWFGLMFSVPWKVEEENGEQYIALKDMTSIC